MENLIFVAIAVSVRLCTLAISLRNESALRNAGAIEHGAGISKAIASAHVAYYLAAIAEGFLTDAPSAPVTDAGLARYLLSIGSLLWVIVTLGRVWTVKLYIAPDHRLVTNWMFRRIRHPNYFLNIIPELMGFALVLNAWITLAVGLPVYLVILSMRIDQEERIMRQTFSHY